MATALETAVRGWIVAAVPSAVAIYGRQNAPRPAGNFGSVALLALVPEGQVEEGPLDANGVRTLTHYYRGTVSLQFFGTDAHAVALAVHAGADLEAVRSVFTAAGLALQDCTALDQVDEVVDERWESRWRFDAFVQMPHDTTETVGWIEHFEITGTVVDTDGDVVVQFAFVAPPA
jgi:hypothetical protein